VICKLCPEKQSLTHPPVAAVIGSGHVTHSKVDRMIIDFVVNNMQAFTIVEQVSFINLVIGQQPGKMAMGRKTVVS